MFSEILEVTWLLVALKIVNNCKLTSESSTDDANFFSFWTSKKRSFEASEHWHCPLSLTMNGFIFFGAMQTMFAQETFLIRKLASFRMKIR